MPQGIANRRKTDATPDRTARAEARLLRLSSEVRAACDKFFTERGMPARLPFMDSPAERITPKP